jgi:hypothetical protein
MSEPTVEEKRVELLIAVSTLASENSAKQYDDYSKTFVALDAKAQATATTGGVVLAAMVAFVNGGKLTDIMTSTPWGKAWVLIPVVGALITVVVSFFAAQVKSVNVPFAADQQVKEVERLSDLPAAEISREHVLGFHRGRLIHWKNALEDVASVVKTKGRRVLASQIVLLVTLGSVLALFIALVSH